MIKKNVNGITLILLSMFVLAIIACSTNEKSILTIKNVQTGSYEKARLKDSLYTNVSIIKAYANEEICSNKTINANLYICRDIRSNDTIYVLETCNKLAWFAKENLHEDFVILNENVKNNIPKSVRILVPKSFFIPSHAKILFSNLTRLED